MVRTPACRREQCVRCPARRRLIRLRFIRIDLTATHLNLLLTGPRGGDVGVRFAGLLGRRCEVLALNADLAAVRTRHADAGPGDLDLLGRRGCATVCRRCLRLGLSDCLRACSTCDCAWRSAARACPTCEAALAAGDVDVQRRWPLEPGHPGGRRAPHSARHNRRWSRRARQSLSPNRRQRRHTVAHPRRPSRSRSPGPAVGVARANGGQVGIQRENLASAAQQTGESHADIATARAGEQQVEVRRRQIDTYKAQADQARAALDNARIALDDTLVYAPYDGTVV